MEWSCPHCDDGGCKNCDTTRCPKCGDELESRTVENEATHTKRACPSCDYGYIAG